MVAVHWRRTSRPPGNQFPSISERLSDHLNPDVFLNLIDEPIVMFHAIDSWLGTVMWSSERAAGTELDRTPWTGSHRTTRPTIAGGVARMTATSGPCS